MKRVYCLYRVSTKKQVDRNAKNENDIPMQRTACHEFADAQQGWEIVEEYSEKGYPAIRCRHRTGTPYRN